MKKTVELKTGDKFNRLTVVKLDHIREKVYYKNNKKYIQKHKYYLCKCDCGNEHIVEGSDLKRGKTKSCGCLQKETRQKVFKNNSFNKKYNMDYTNIKQCRLYNIWCDIKKRCYNKKFWAFNRYGGRNINMCNDWKNDFKVFHDWAINNGYNDNLTIDRINNNGNYEPNNCRWVDMKTQCRNKNNNHLITYNEETHCISEWIEIMGFHKYLNYKQVINKLNNYFKNV